MVVHSDLLVWSPPLAIKFVGWDKDNLLAIVYTGRVMACTYL